MADPKTADRDDLLSRIRMREIVVFCLIALIAIVANLPRDAIRGLIGIDYEILYGVLGSLVVIALFLYLKFFVFLAVVLLIVGANLPEQLADSFGISKIPLVLALVAMVGMSLINYVVKLMPTGLEPKRKEPSPEGVRAMFYAIEKNNPVYLQKVLTMNFDPNLVHDNGYTPLAYAAMKGNVQILELLLSNGADPSGKTAKGDTPVELALSMGHQEAAELLRRTRQEAEARLAAQAQTQKS